MPPFERSRPCFPLRILIFLASGLCIALLHLRPVLAETVAEYKARLQKNKIEGNARFLQNMKNAAKTIWSVARGNPVGAAVNGAKFSKGALNEAKYLSNPENYGIPYPKVPTYRPAPKAPTYRPPTSSSVNEKNQQAAKQLAEQRRLEQQRQRQYEDGLRRERYKRERIERQARLEKLRGIRQQEVHERQREYKRRRAEKHERLRRRMPARKARH